MKFLQLTYFCEAYRYENMTLASHHLHISQPSVSMAIKELETQFDTALFIRHGRKLIPTKEGDMLYQLSTQLLEHANNVESLMKDIKQTRKIIRLGVTPMVDVFLFPQIFREFTKLNPNIQVSIHELGSDHLMQAIRNNAIDLAFITHIDSIENDLVSYPITSIETVYCVAKAHPLSSQKCVKITDIAQQPLILFKEGYVITKYVHSLLVATGIELDSPNIFYTDQLSTARTYISEAMFTGFLYRPIAEKMDNVTPISLDPPVIANISLVWMQDYQKYPHIKAFIHFIKKKYTTFQREKD